MIYFKDGELSILDQDQRDCDVDLCDGESSILVVQDQGDGQVDLTDQVQDEDENHSFKETDLPNSNQSNTCKTFEELNHFFDKVSIK